MANEDFDNLDDAANPFAHDPSVQHALTPLWREARWPLEWMQLRTSPVYYGWGVPHGEGEPVLLIPGFMSGDSLMLELHRWLKRIGYQSYLSNIVWNNDCPDHTARKLASKVLRIQREHGQRVRLIGHSLGGMLAKSILQDHPERIDRVITLGSPFRSMVKAHPAVVGLWDQLKMMRSGLVGRNLHASCGTGHCLCNFVKNMAQPRPVPVAQYAVFSRKDGVAHWSSCMEEEHGANTEVTSTHIGMVVDAEVFRAIARRLHQRTASADPTPGEA